jgi:hypothetical protein
MLKYIQAYFQKKKKREKVTIQTKYLEGYDMTNWTEYRLAGETPSRRVFFSLINFRRTMLHLYTMDSKLFITI